jgi:hypothetical protein
MEEKQFGPKSVQGPVSTGEAATPVNRTAKDFPGDAAVDTSFDPQLKRHLHAMEKQGRVEVIDPLPPPPPAPDAQYEHETDADYKKRLAEPKKPAPKGA